MDLLSTVRKSGSRGGVNFSWDDVATSARRENYLGHSLKAPVGRWQKGRELDWYAKADSPAAAGEAAATASGSHLTDEQRRTLERREEIRRIKEAEEEAMQRALGLPITPKNATGANAVEVSSDVPGRMQPTDNNAKASSMASRNGDRTGDGGNGGGGATRGELRGNGATSSRRVASSGGVADRGPEGLLAADDKVRDRRHHRDHDKRRRRHRDGDDERRHRRRSRSRSRSQSPIRSRSRNRGQGRQRGEELDKERDRDSARGWRGGDRGEKRPHGTRRSASRERWGEQRSGESDARRVLRHGEKMRRSRSRDEYYHSERRSRRGLETQKGKVEDRSGGWGCDHDDDGRPDQEQSHQSRSEGRIRHQDERSDEDVRGKRQRRWESGRDRSRSRSREGDRLGKGSGNGAGVYSRDGRPDY